VNALGDRVKMWTTLNEPHVSAFLGYFEGRFAPGHTDLHEALAASHHLLLAHGQAVPVIRSRCPGAQVGIALDYRAQTPASLSPADRAAAWLAGGEINRWFLDPLAGRGYPEDVRQAYGDDLQFVLPGDLRAVAAPIDFLGLNYYFRNIARSTAIPESENAPRAVFPGDEVTEMGWEVYPRGLLEMLAHVHFTYGFPSYYITENGAAVPDVVGPDGAVDDARRVSYIRRHLQTLHQAVELGLPVEGYFVWSLMDNFEWSEGFSKRFGLFYVDYGSQRRIPKTSAGWYRDVIRRNAVELLSGDVEPRASPRR
jgi:beta-glucosidase